MIRSSAVCAVVRPGKEPAAGIPAVDMNYQLSNHSPKGPLLMGELPGSNTTVIPDTKVQTQWVLVTPEMAKDFLESNTENRGKKDGHLNKLVADMENDRFSTTHLGVAFDDRGILVDGQHRLIAIMRSGISQWLLVTSGLGEDAKAKIDTGVKRSVQEFMPGKNKNEMASAIRYLLALESMGHKFSAASFKVYAQEVTMAQIQEAWERWNNLDDMAYLARKAAKNCALGPSSLLVAATCYPNSGKDFLQGVISMNNLEADDPRLALIKYRGPAGKALSQGMMVYLAVKAAKAFDEGQPVKHLRASTQEVIKV